MGSKRGWGLAVSLCGFVACLGFAKGAWAQDWELIDLGAMRTATTINNHGVVGGGPYRYTPALGVELVLQPAQWPVGAESFTHITDGDDYVGSVSRQVNGPGGGACSWRNYPVNTDPQEFSAPLRIGASGLQVGQCDRLCYYPVLSKNACLRNVDGSLTMLDFGETTIPTQDAAWSINSSDVVVGEASRGPNLGALRAFAYQNSTLVDLGTLGGNQSGARDISDAGIIVGWAEKVDGKRRAFRYDMTDDAPVMEELGALEGGESEAHAINESGLIVGSSTVGENRAVLWGVGEGVTDLTSLLSIPTMWTFLSADGVNERGEIVGQGVVGSGSEARYSGFLLRPRPETGSRLNNDYSGDVIGDSVVWRPSDGYWYIKNSDSPQNPSLYQWGLPGDIPLRADFDGDNRMDLVVWRPAEGMWYRCYSASGYNCSSGDSLQFGLSVDYPLTGDFDGDNREDVAVWRPLFQSPGIFIEGQWYYRHTASGASFTEQWGLRDDLPVADDFDGDGKTDLAVWRPDTGVWYILKSSEQYNKNTALVRQWGLPGDHPMPMDVDGDGRAELVVWRPSNGNWYLCRSRTDFDCSQGVVHQFGLPGDVPVRGTFDGSISANLAIWRPSEGTWYIRSLNTGLVSVNQWGLSGDVPLGLGIKDSVS